MNSHQFLPTVAYDASHAMRWSRIQVQQLRGDESLMLIILTQRRRVSYIAARV